MTSNLRWRVRLEIQWCDPETETGFNKIDRVLEISEHAQADSKMLSLETAKLFNFCLRTLRAKGIVV